MERDVIVLYIIAGVSFSFALFNCILFAIKHGKTKIGRASCRERVSGHESRSRWSPYH